MKNTIISLQAIALTLLITACAPTLDDIAKWEATGNQEKLIEALEDANPSIGIAAAEALGNLQALPALDPLAACFNSTNDQLVITAVQSIAHLQHPDAITPLTAALRLPQPEAQQIAIQALGDQKATAAIETLCDQLASAPQDQQLMIVTALQKIASPQASPALIAALESNHPTLQTAAARALGHTGGTGTIAALLPLLASSNRTLAQAASDALYQRGQESVQPLIKTLRRKQQKLRNQAILLLEKLDAVPLQGPDSIWFQLANAAKQQLQKIDPTIIADIAQQKSIETLLNGAAHPNEIIRNHAITALEKMEQTSLDEAYARAKEIGDPWFNNRNQWPGAPDWRIDLWAALRSLNPDLPTAPYRSIPNHIRDLESSLTRASALDALRTLDTHTPLPLIAALNQTPFPIAEQAALLLSEQPDPRALQPLIQRIQTELHKNTPLTKSPLNEALQQLNLPEAEPTLRRIRPNTERAIRLFEKQYPEKRVISVERMEPTSPTTERYRIGYTSTGRIKDFTLTFQRTPESQWIIQPSLPAELP